MPRKLMWLLLLALPASAANMRYTNWCEIGGRLVNISPKNSSPAKFQQSFPGCTITVYLTGSLTLATIYADTLNTPLANPFTANAITGQFFFYAADGRYDIQLGGTLTPAFTIGDVLFNTSSGGGGGGGTVTSVALTMPTFFTVTGTPITAAGTFNVSMATGQTSHRVLGTGAGTSFGVVQLTTADLPFTYSGNTAVLGTVSGTFTSGHQIVADANGNLIDGGAPSAGGTVTSVTFTGDGTVLSSTPSSAVTTSGTLLAALATFGAHKVLGNFTGSTATPTVGSITTAELPFTYTNSGSTKLATSTGSLTNGHCASWDASGNIVDFGSACGGGGGGGTVTSVGLAGPTGFTISGSPVVASGTLTFALPSGWTTGSLLLGNGANSASSLLIGANGTSLQSNGTTASWQTAGTVSSVGLSLPAMFTVSGSPVTTTGTLTGVLASQSAHKWLGNATAGSAVPSFSSIGTGDLPFTYSNASNTKLATTTGTLNTGHCVSIASGGDFVDAGANCASGSGTPGGTSGQVQFNSAGAFGGFTASGDATINTSTGAVTVSATGGVAFAASATTNALNATNISSGTLGAGRLPAFTGGDATTVAGGGVITLNTVNSNVGICGDATHYPLPNLNAKGLVTSCTTQLVPNPASPTWNSIQNPSGGSLALSMAHFTTNWTYDATTGTNTMMLITDTASNTGTAPLWRSTTAASSTAIPWQADANGVGWQVTSSGAFASVGAGGIPFRLGPGLVGAAPSTPSASNVIGYYDSTILRWNSIDANGVVSDYVARLPGTISVTGQTAAITTATLCSTGNCGTAGFYRVSASLVSSLVCATPGPAIAGITIGWTDDASAKTLKLPLVGTGLSGSDVTLGQTTAFGQFTFDTWSTGAAAITYATNYTACTTGTGTYSLRLSVERIF